MSSETGPQADRDRLILAARQQFAAWMHFAAVRFMGVWAWLGATARRVQDYRGPIAAAISTATLILKPVGAFFVNGAIVRFVTGSLLRRIIVSNLIGLLILCGGYLYITQQRAWLIEAKIDSLKAQGEIIAAAIAGNAKLRGQTLEINPDRLPDRGTPSLPFNNDEISRLELTLGPEKVTPILKRIMPLTTSRARVYARDGTLITDSSRIPTRGKLGAPQRDPAADNPQPNTKSFWTRMLQYISNSDLTVYKEIGTAKGTLYPEVRQALTGTAKPLRQLTSDGQQIVSIAIPIERNNSILGVLLLSTQPGEIDVIQAEERWAILRVALLALAATIAASWVLAQTVAGPMRRLSAAAEQVNRQINARQDLPDFSSRRDEVGQMAQAFTTMTKSLYRRIEASEKFAADVAHELKNPLTAARSTAESLDYARTDEERQQLVIQIQEELKRLNRLITDISNTSRLDAELALQETEPLDVRELLKGIVATFSDLFSDDDRNVTLELAPPSRGSNPYVVLGHPGRLAQVMSNLLDNAMTFTAENTVVTVKAQEVDNDIEIIVEDEGPGVEEDKLEKIFSRFYTYRPTAESSRGNNSGLGLAIAREIVLAHDGKIWAENRSAGDPGKCAGARFVVRLPRADSRRHRDRTALQRGRNT